MKGKNYTAAEKHFKEKEIKYQRELNRISEESQAVAKANVALVKENEVLKKENEAINLKYEKLLEYSKLSDEDIKKALQSDEAKSELSGLLKVLYKYM